MACIFLGMLGMHGLEICSAGSVNRLPGTASVCCVWLFLCSGAGFPWRSGVSWGGGCIDIGHCSEGSLDCKEIQPVHPKGDQPWIFTGRTDAEAEAPILWPPDAKNWLIGTDPDAGKDWGQEKKETTEDEMVGWVSLTQTWVWANSGK